MNIFYLDRDPVKAAQMSCDKHVVKMILESAQMLCTAKRVLDGIEWTDYTKNGRKIRRWRLENPNEEAIIYKAGWLKHPSTQWVMASSYNYMWLYRHMMALNNGGAYKKYRDLRESGIDDPYILVETLDAYAADKHYFSKIKSILKKIRSEYDT